MTALLFGICGIEQFAFRPAACGADSNEGALLDFVGANAKIGLGADKNKGQENREMTNNSFLFAGVYLVAAILNGTLLGQAASENTERESFLDTVQTRAGHLARVKVIEESKEKGGTFLVFKTRSGGYFRLQKGRAYKKTSPADPILAEYEAMVGQIEDSPEAHWRVVNWLGRQERGKLKYAPQRTFHLERILELDPNDERAFKLLGYKDLDGQWVNRDLLHTYYGYINQGGRWFTSEQVKLNDRKEKADEKVGSLNKSLMRWKKHVLGKEASNVVTRKLFDLVVDDTAIPLILKMFKREKNPQVQKLYVDAIGRLPTPRASSALVSIAILAPTEPVRERAIVLSKQEHYNLFRSVAVASKYLTNPNNIVIRRAAILIGELGADNAPYYLIDALVTTHKYETGEQKGRMNSGFSSDGSLNSFSVGGDDSPKIINHKNSEVHSAIVRITGQDFGYDEDTWRKWYVENYTSQEDDLRRDD